MEQNNLQENFDIWREKFIKDLQEELDKLRDSFKEEMEQYLAAQKKNIVLNDSKHTVQFKPGQTQAKSKLIVNGKVINEEEHDEETPSIDGKALSEEIIKNVWEQLAKVNITDKNKEK